MSTSVASSTLVTTTGLNKLAVVSAIAAVIALAGIVFLGFSTLAVFAVGAGHVSLAQIRRTGEKGRWLVVSSLVISYALATWALISSLMYIPALLQN